MRSSHTIAAWLFDRLDLDVALSGDLMEERERGRSAIWYWRQVLIAVWVGIWGAIRDHKVMALRAVATGFAMEYFFLFLWEHQGVLFKSHGLPLISIVMWIGNLSVVLLTQTTTGWVVARTHRAHHIPMVFVFLTCFFFWYFGPQLFWSVRMLVDWDRIDPAVHPYVLYTLMISFLTVVSVLFGGILAQPKKAPSTAHPGAA
jgi:hypothetical protein